MIWGQSALRFAQYKAWANERTFGDIADLDSDELYRKRDSLFGSIVHTLNHNYVIDAIFKAHLLNRQHGYRARNTPQPPPINELIDQQKQMDAWWLSFARQLTVDNAAEIVHFEFVDGGAGMMTRGEILMHVVNHNTYHRGFIAEMLYQVPIQPSATDLPVFAREFPAPSAQ